MNVLQFVREGFVEIREHGGRTLLQALGVILGVASVVATLGLTSGQEAARQEYYRESGGTRLMGVYTRIPSRLTLSAAERYRSGFSRREMRSALIPLTTYAGLEGGGRRVPTMVVRVAGTDRLAGTLAYLKNHLRRHHNRVEDFRVENVAGQLLREEAEIRDLLRGWTVVLFAISAISLVVGGVGIFSVLQISLAERLYEIGLRKSMGARDADMLLQFLVEAVFLSVLGALVGIGLGAGLCLVLGPHFEAGLPVSGFAVLVAALFAVGVGLAAGIYPSLRAARLTPVEALRG